MLTGGQDKRGRDTKNGPFTACLVTCVLAMVDRFVLGFRLKIFFFFLRLQDARERSHWVARTAAR